MKISSSSFTFILLIYTLSIIGISSCNKEDKIDPAKSQTDLLIGDWQMVEKDGHDYPAPNTSAIFTFEDSGDAQLCFTDNDDPINSGCDSYKWRWQDNTNSAITITFGSDEVKFDVILLDETNLNYSITFSDGFSSSYKYLRIE